MHAGNSTAGMGWKMEKIEREGADHCKIQIVAFSPSFCVSAFEENMLPIVYRQVEYFQDCHVHFAEDVRRTVSGEFDWVPGAWDGSMGKVTIARQGVDVVSIWQ